jgi:polar amino acid transport system substrate-binding protein
MSAVRQAVAALDSSSRDAVLFEEGLQRYRANGRLQQLLQGYGVQRL